MNARPTWEDAFAGVGSEEWLTAKALMEVDPHRTLINDAVQFISPNGNGYRADDGSWVEEVTVDWDAWVEDVYERGRGWSSTENRLFNLVASLVTDRLVSIRDVLGYLGSWEYDVWRILVDWGTGGNNREHPGRASVRPS